MPDKKNHLLKISLALFALIALVFGISYLFFPEVQISSTGGEPIDPGWVRWVGGIFIALGVGSIMVFRKPLKQGIFVTTIALGSSLLSLTLLYSMLYENEGYNLVHVLTPVIVLSLLSILLWISLKQSKDILW